MHQAKENCETWWKKDSKQEMELNKNVIDGNADGFKRQEMEKKRLGATYLHTRD